MTDFEKEIKEKLDAGVELTESELAKLSWHGIEDIEGEDHRWQREVKTIFQLGDDFYALDWMRGLTENHEDNYWKQPYKVKKVEEVVTVHRWVPVKD